MNITFIFNALKDKNAMVKCKQHPVQKQPHYTANKTSALCQDLYRQHTNAKLAKNQE